MDQKSRKAIDMEIDMMVEFKKPEKKPVSEIVESPDHVASLYNRMKDLKAIEMGFEMFVRELPGEGMDALNIILKIADHLKELGYKADEQ